MYQSGRNSWKLMIGIMSVALTITLLLGLIPLLEMISGVGKVYKTDNINDYGKYVGNFDNEKPTLFIESFFPITIEDYFSEIKYHYKAKKGDTYAYQAYLEFEIKDPETFLAYLNANIETSECIPFQYDNSYMEYSVSNILHLDLQEDTDGEFPILYANIGKVLYSAEKHKFIFFALGVFDGGGTNTAELSYFFDRFDVDVKDYYRNAYYSYQDQEEGILVKDRIKNDLLP